MTVCPPPEPIEDDEYEASPYTLAERLEVDVAGDDPCGTILDHRGAVLSVVYPDRLPFGFHP